MTDQSDSNPVLRFDGPAAASLTFAFAHGAGAPMDTVFMNSFAEGIADAGFRVARFEFDYMAGRRTGGKKRPPDRQPKLLECWRKVIETLGPDRLVIGGKSMGGRMASLVADETRVRGLICLGYPFHPPGKPERLRTEHLADLATPTLIVQGTRDPFGTELEVPDYDLSPAIALHWAPDGNHDLTPRKASGHTQAENWTAALAAIVAFLKRLDR